MLDRQVDRGLQRVVGVGHAVVRFVTRLEAVQDFHGLAHRRLDDVDLLEAPRERAVLLEDAAVFLERGRTDAAQLARGEHGLDQVRGIHRAARRGAGADDRMDLVDEQDRAGVLLQLREHGLQALLEIAAVLGAGDQRAEVERVDDRVGQHFGHVAFDDALGQAFGERGLAHAGFAHVERVVLATAAQHLDGAFDFVGAADQRVDLAGEREVVEVAGEFGERVALVFALLALPRLVLGLRFLAFAGAGDAVREIVDDIQPRDVLLVQEIDGVRILFAVDGDQDVGAGDFLLARGLHVVDGALQHALEPQRGLRVAAVVVGQARDRGFDRLVQLMAQAGEIRADRLEDGFGGGVVEQREEQVLHGHELMAGFARPLVALADGLLEIFAEHDAVASDCWPCGYLPLYGDAETFPVANARANRRRLAAVFTPFPSCRARGAG